MPPICAVLKLRAGAAVLVPLVSGAAVAFVGADEDEDEDELVLVLKLELELVKKLVDSVGATVTEGVM